MARVDAIARPVVPPLEVAPPRLRSLRRLLPLWRHAVWLTTLFGLLVAGAVVRLDVQQLHKDLDRNARAQREARVLNDRLRLEIDARRRAVAMEAAARSMALGPDARLVAVGVEAP